MWFNEILCSIIKYNCWICFGCGFFFVEFKVVGIFKFYVFIIGIVVDFCCVNFFEEFFVVNVECFKVYKVCLIVFFCKFNKVKKVDIFKD